MASDSQYCQVKWKPVDQPEQELGYADCVDELSKEFRGEDRVLLDELGEIVETGSDREGEEAESKEEAEIAQQREDVHDGMRRGVLEVIEGRTIGLLAQKVVAGNWEASYAATTPTKDHSK